MDVLAGFEPGPIVREPLPLRERIVQPGTFEGLAGDMSRVLGASETVLGGAVAAIAPAVGASLDPNFAADVAPAADTVQTIGTVDDPSAPGAAVAGLGAADSDIDGQTRELPGADALEPSDDSDGAFEADNPPPRESGDREPATQE